MLFGLLYIYTFSLRKKDIDTNNVQRFFQLKQHKSILNRTKNVLPNQKPTPNSVYNIIYKYFGWAIMMILLGSLFRVLCSGHLDRENDTHTYTIWFVFCYCFRFCCCCSRNDFGSCGLFRAAASIRTNMPLMKNYAKTVKKRRRMKRNEQRMNVKINSRATMLMMMTANSVLTFQNSKVDTQNE